MDFLHRISTEKSKIFPSIFTPSFALHAGSLGVILSCKSNPIFIFHTINPEFRPLKEEKKEEIKRLLQYWFIVFIVKLCDCPALVHYLLKTYTVHSGCLSELLLCCCKALCTAEHTIHIHVNFAGRHLCLLKIARWEKGSNTLYRNIHEGSRCDWPETLRSSSCGGLNACRDPLWLH